MVDYQVGTGTLRINLKIYENDVLEDHHQEEDVMEFRVKDEDEVIEVQIPKDNDDINNDNKRRICHVCNKRFGSGKALGGHMRIHVQASKKQLQTKKSKPRILQKEEEGGDLENCNNYQLLPTCSVCGKNFPSMKSLFGHMRCHPERAWRGIQPPHLKSSDEIHIKRAKKTASATITTQVLGWSVTAKRGRKPNAEETTTNSVSKDDEQLQDAVHHLMLLANRDSIESGVTGGGHDTPEELEKTNSNSLTSKAENEEFVSELKIIDNRKRRKKKMKLRHLNSVSPASATAATPEKYTCGKSFTTHQALGGHKSSHNEFVIQNSDVTNVAASNSNLPDNKLSSQLNSPVRRILDFDLNELPPDHEDELPGNHEFFPLFPI